MKKPFIKPMVPLFVVLALAVVLYQFGSNYPKRNDEVTDFYIRAGIGPDLTTCKCEINTEEQNSLSNRVVFEGEWRQNLSLTVTVGCTAEDIFGTREAYLAMFDTNEDDAGTEDEKTTDPVK
jgi:hypothetical protein